MRDRDYYCTNILTSTNNNENGDLTDSLLYRSKNNCCKHFSHVFSTAVFDPFYYSMKTENSISRHLQT